jgi:transposase
MSGRHRSEGTTSGWEGSCRKLEHACKDSVEVMWLLKARRPHYKTIAKFRKDNAKAFRQVFRTFVLIMKEWNLVDGKHIAIDSFKVRAQNSLKILDCSTM